MFTLRADGGSHIPAAAKTEQHKDSAKTEEISLISFALIENCMINDSYFTFNKSCISKILLEESRSVTLAPRCVFTEVPERIFKCKYVLPSESVWTYTNIRSFYCEWTHGMAV